MSVEADRTSLEINEVFVEDAGEYCVIARNSVGEAHTACHVYVTASSLPQQPADAAAEVSDSHPPGFTYVFDDLTASVGQPCTMRVTVTGSPLPKVYCAYISTCSFQTKLLPIFCSFS